jgi:hypothetical protein
MTVLQIVAYKVVDIGDVTPRQIFFKHNQHKYFHKLNPKSALSAQSA